MTDKDPTERLLDLADGLGDVAGAASKAAVALGSRGGKASAAKLTPKQRIARAKNASRARQPKCDCGKCLTCKRRKYKREWRKRKGTS